MDVKPEDPSGTLPATDRKKQTAAAPRTDTGWAWVVVCASFVVYFASVGFISSYSVYLTIWMEYFDASAVTAGLVISIGLLMRGILSPVSGALCTKFGPRVVMIVGGVLIVIGAAMGSQSPNIELLILSNGFVAAMGASMVFVAAIHVLGMYFHKRYAVAVGLSSAGVSAGQLAFPPMVTYLIDIYGWKGSMLIIAAINMHIIAAGALMRPVVKKKRKRKLRKENDAQKSGQDQVIVSENVSKVENGTTVTQNDIGESEGNSLGDLDDEQSDYRDVAVILADNSSDSAELITEGNVRPVETTVNPFVAAIAEDGLDQLNLPESLIDDTDKTDSVWGYLVRYSSHFKHFLLDTFGLKRLVHNMRFAITITAAFAHGFGKLGVVYIVARAESVGVDLNSAALLLSIFGAGSIVARICYGWFVDKKYITGEMTYALALLVFCLTVSLAPAFVDFAPLAILAALLGMAAGTAASIVMVIIRAQVQRSDAAGAIGIILLFTSLGNVAGILVSGITYDATESYDIAFFTAGAILLVASLLCVAVYFLQKAKHFRRHLPAAMFYVKLPKKTKAENQLQQVDSTLGQPDTEFGGSVSDDLGIVNPVCMLTEEVLDIDEVARDREMLGSVHQEKNKPLMKLRFGQKREVYKMEGIENPMTVVQGSVDFTSGENVSTDGNMWSEIGKAENDLNTNFTGGVPKQETTPDNSADEREEALPSPVVSADESSCVPTLEDISEDEDKSGKVGIADPESHNSSLPADATPSSTSSFAEDDIDRGFENPIFAAEHGVLRDNEELMTGGCERDEFDVGFEIENLGFDGDISDILDSDDISCKSGQSDQGSQDDRL